MRNQGWSVGVAILLNQKPLTWYVLVHLIASRTWEHVLPHALKPACLEAVAVMSGNKLFYYFIGYWSLPQGSTISSFSPTYYLLNYWLHLGSPVLQSTGNSSALNEVSKMIDNASVMISACSLRTFRWDYLSLLIYEHLVCRHIFVIHFTSPNYFFLNWSHFLTNWIESAALNTKKLIRCLPMPYLCSLTKVNDKCKIQIRAHISLREMYSFMLQSISLI